MSSLGVEEQADCFGTMCATNGQYVQLQLVPFCGFFVKRMKIKFIADFSYHQVVGATNLITPAGGIYQIVVNELGNLPIAQFGLSSYYMLNGAPTEIGGAQVNIDDEVVFDTALQMSGRPFTLSVLRWDATSKTYMQDFADPDSGGVVFPKSIAVHLKFYKH